MCPAVVATGAQSRDAHVPQPRTSKVMYQPHGHRTGWGATQHSSAFLFFLLAAFDSRARDRTHAAAMTALDPSPARPSGTSCIHFFRVIRRQTH